MTLTLNKMPELFPSCSCHAFVYFFRLKTKSILYSTLASRQGRPTRSIKETIMAKIFFLLLAFSFSVNKKVRGISPGIN